MDTQDFDFLISKYSDDLMQMKEKWSKWGFVTEEKKMEAPIEEAIPAVAMTEKMQDIPDEIEKLKALMKVASGQLDFERAIEIREKIAELKLKLRKAQR